jgi:MFS family permease
VLEPLRKHRWFIIALLTISALINYLDRATLSIALPKISIDLSLGPAAKGLLLSAFFWSYALMQVPMGWFADRYNVYWLYAGSFALWSLACGLTGIAGSLAMAILFRIILGVGEAIYLPGCMRLITQLFAPQDRGLPSGLLDLGTRTGLALGAPLVAWLTTHYGWRRMFFVVGFSALLWLPFWLLAMPSRLRGDRRSAGGKGKADGRHAQGFIIDRNLLGCCLGGFCFGYYQYLLVTWLPDFLVQVRHLSILEAGAYSSLTYFVWALSGPFGGWISDRMVHHGLDETRVRKGVITAAFSTGLLLIPAAYVSNTGWVLTLVAGSSLVGLATGNMLVIYQCCAPRGQIGIWSGTVNFVGNIGGALSPLATGILISRTGSYFPGFAVAPVVLVTGLLSYWLIVGELKPAGSFKPESQNQAMEG